MAQNSNMPVFLSKALADFYADADQRKKDSGSIWGFYEKKGVNIPFLSPKRLSQQLGLSIKTLERMRKDGSGPPFIRTGSKQIRYPIIELDRWVSRQILIAETSSKDTPL